MKPRALEKGKWYIWRRNSRGRKWVERWRYRRSIFASNSSIKRMQYGGMPRATNNPLDGKWIHFFDSGKNRQHEQLIVRDSDIASMSFDPDQRDDPLAPEVAGQRDQLNSELRAEVVESPSGERHGRE